MLSYKLWLPVSIITLLIGLAWWLYIYTQGLPVYFFEVPEEVQLINALHFITAFFLNIAVNFLVGIILIMASIAFFLKYKYFNLSNLLKRGDKK